MLLLLVDIVVVVAADAAVGVVGIVVVVAAWVLSTAAAAAADDGSCRDRLRFVAEVSDSFEPSFDRKARRYPRCYSWSSSMLVDRPV